MNTILMMNYNIGTVTKHDYYYYYSS